MKSRSRDLTSFCFIILSAVHMMACSTTSPRTTEDFGAAWRFHPGDVPNGFAPGLDDAQWRVLDLPHDWSIEGEFSKDHPATTGGGALPGGIGWYRKSFQIPASDTSRLTFVEFDGIYRNGEVWINGNYLGKRPYGYSSFRVDCTPFVQYGDAPNVIAVRVDNSQQPNSRWYSGSGIYRNVRLVMTGPVCVDHWGTFIATSAVSEASAVIAIETKVRNYTANSQRVRVATEIFNGDGVRLAREESECEVPGDSVGSHTQKFDMPEPPLWSIENPRLLKAVISLTCDGSVVDRYETPFGIRRFAFDSAAGFTLNGKPVKIRGVCNHHDLGCLGAAVNRRAIERQLEIMRRMGVNAIRTSHNPPAPELLDLCDAMGFIVMDEAFDIWKMKKTDFDYALDWDAWHVRDLEDMVLRDRNHPSVMIWSIGNEVNEQHDKKDSSGTVIARELAGIVRRLDPTRPITAACNNQDPMNPVIRSGALDLVGCNYSHRKFAEFPRTFPGKKWIGTETTSAIATRGHYDMPSDSIRRWPTRWDVPFTDGNPDFTVSSYDNCSVPWGSTHRETWSIVKEHPFLSGIFIWTGFDYLGEPTPYPWPARSSYFGIVDLAGFPKDAYYLYQSEWTETPVLHLLPHWNWKPGDGVDVWAYTNCEEVELFVNGESRGAKKKGDSLHIAWRVTYAPGSLKAIGRTGGREVLVREVKTAGDPARIVLEPDRGVISSDGKDLSFITVKILDGAGTVVPHADQLVTFTVTGEGRLVGVDNGSQTSLESFKASSRKAFNGMCLAVVQSRTSPGRITVAASADGLAGASVDVISR